MLLDIESVLTYLYHIMSTFWRPTARAGGYGRCRPQSPFQSSNTASCWQLHVEWIIRGWTWILIPYARVQQAKMAWDQTSYVHIFGNCEQGLRGWVVTQSPFYKVPKQLAVDGSKLSERCKAGATGPTSCTNTRV